jgi:glycosyltransferase involved in cell wall biosynthesis
LIFEVRDLWPESAVELGELSHPAAISWAKKLEGACYARARKIIVVTNGILNRLVQRSIQNDKLILIPNGANTTMFVFKSDKRATTRKELGLEGKFIAVYAGIFGLAQHLETIVETARILKDNRKIYFILIGDGPQKKIINTLIQHYSLPNLCVLPEQPRELIPGYLSAADVSIIPLKKAEIFKGALPSKIFDAWSCSLPVLISIDGEARDLVDRINAGRYVDPENPEKMAEALVEMSNHKDEIEEMGRNGRTYVEQYHSRQALAKKLIEELAKIIDKNG